MQLTAQRYDTLRPARLTIADGKLADVVDLAGNADAPPDLYVAPAFFDLQINGHAGIWFGDPGLTVDQVLTVLEAHFAHGISRLCPTLITNSFEGIRDGLAVIRAACEQEPWADRMVPGCHVEGPYISAEDGPRGAHPLEHVRGCNVEEFDRWQAASGDRIRLITLAPEAPGAAEFTRALTSRGVRVAIGHTAASTDQIAAVVDTGATLSTHLGNGAAGMMRRHPNPIWDQLADDRLSASVIADGHHLPASVLQVMIRAKGVERIVLTCDASGLAGLPPGVYDYHGAKFEVLADGPIVIAGQRQYLAGSGQMTDICVANAIALGGVTLQQACDMAGRTPSRLLGIEQVTLTAGARADLVLFRWPGAGAPLEILATLADGVLRHGTIDLD
ncbi:MAG: N-acetylglucosamine-6-phosphate deacetylase [Planctomycetaceae bacterium]|nr:N-acetylglucosamine-6-phosphate deacetylase [Planctomycetaceae bacterium]